MITPPESIVVRPDTMVTLSCLAWSYGRLGYTWMKNNNSILSSNSIHIGCSDTAHKLTISNVQVIDEGAYCCIVSNECGNLTRCSWLEVDSKS